jgi:hypothetical protein
LNARKCFIHEAALHNSNNSNSNNDPPRKRITEIVRVPFFLFHQPQPLVFFFLSSSSAIENVADNFRERREPAGPWDEWRHQYDTHGAITAGAFN